MIGHVRRLAPLGLALLLVVVVPALGLAQGYTPPHSRPGPASEKLQFQSVHVDLASRVLRAGDIDFYLFSLKTEQAATLKGAPGVTIYEAPATMLDIILNPAPAPEGQLNPFSIPEVRRAVQFLVNRPFITQETYKGLAEPMLTWVSPRDYDYLAIADMLRERAISYDPELARDMISKAMTTAGAQLQSGRWQFRGRPVEVKFIIRVEDERRQIGDLVRAEMEKAGFTVASLYLDFAPAVQQVYSTDPKLLQWHMYTEGWSRGAAERYDFATANQMAAPWLGNMPGWKEVGFWQYENKQLDDLGQKLFRGEFSGPEDRNRIYRDVASVSLDESVRVWLATVVNSFPAMDKLTGVSQDVTAGPKSLWTLREAYIPGRDTLKLGSLWVWTERSTWNPQGGFGDLYSSDIWQSLHDPPTARNPFTGVPVPFRAQYQVETSGPQGKLDVPTAAIAWDAGAGSWRSVALGTKATSKVIFDYSKYFQSKWHHGQRISMADVLYSIYQNFDMTYNDQKAKVEVALAATRRPYLDTFKGFRILDDNRLEVYVDYWHFDTNYIAEYASPTGLDMPWEVLAALDRLVFEQRRAAYSDTAAGRLGLPWISLVMPQHLALLRRSLIELRDAPAVPPALQVAGRSLATPDEAKARYQAVLDWMAKYNLGAISNGGFQLTRFDAAAQFAEAIAFRDPGYPFKPGDLYKGAAQPVSIGRVEALPVVVGSPGQVDVAISGPGTLSLRYALFNPVSRQVTASGEAAPGPAGQFRVELPAQQTSSLKPGPYQLFLTAFSQQLASPTERRVDIQVLATAPQATPTVTAPPGTPKPAASPTPAVQSGGGFPLGIVAVVVAGALMVVAVVLFLVLRRGGKPAS